MKDQKSIAIGRLRELAEELDGKDLHWRGTREFSEWRMQTETAMQRLFGSESRNVKRFRVITWQPAVLTDFTTQQDRDSAFFGSLEMATAVLSAAIREYEDYEDGDESDPPNLAAMDDPSFESILHPLIIRHALSQFRNDHFRDAVLNSMVAVFDLVRERTRVDADGTSLVTKVFSVSKPILRVADVNTESGRNEQIGFLDIMKGAYSAVRNPKAHSLRDQPEKSVAAQYMVFASLLARRVEDAEIVT